MILANKDKAPHMTEQFYKILTWLTYHLAASIALGIPIILFIWASIKQEKSIKRLISIYLKISSLMPISMLLLTDSKPIGYLVSFIAPLFMVGSIWFWIDLNEEIEDSPPFKALPLTIKIWRWCISFWGLFYLSLSSLSLQCFKTISDSKCIAWQEAPKKLHFITQGIFNFLFGGDWSQSLASFIGYLSLIIYIIGFTQWLLTRLPKQGRIAGDF